MTAPFLVMVWRDGIGRARAHQARLVQPGNLIEVVEGPGHLVAVSPAGARSSERDLLVLGSLHEGCATHQQCGALDRLRILVAENWGSYVAFVTDGDGTHYAMVDPSGAGRAHLIEDRHLILVTNRLDPALARAAGFTTGVDIQAIAGCLLDPGTMVTAPLLHGVTPMIPGTAYPLGADKAPVTLWDPIKIAEGSTEECDGSSLRSAVDTAIVGMAGKASLLELSGGLDSSIVAGTAAALGLPVRSVTVEMIGGDVDERRYAEATATTWGLPLHHGRTSTYPDYATFMDVEQAAHPYMYGLDDAFARVVTDALTGEVTQVVTGQGGDAVFFQPATPLTTIDRVRALGVRSGWRELLDDAWRTRASIWHHVIPAAMDYFRPVVIPQDELAGELLTRDARENRKRFVHPWCTNDRLPPGRGLQLLMLANSQVFHSVRAIDLGRPLVHPLLSQPVLESALAIPTWCLASGPHDRGLARRIFADRLHPDVATRRSKGEAAAFYSRAAVDNLPYLRERLLGGALVKAGVVDQGTMERVLTPEYLFHSLDYRALILHAACEAWLRAWTT